MSGISTYGANLFAGAIAGYWYTPETLYLAVSTSEPSPDMDASQLSEPVVDETYTSYARQPIQMMDTFWGEPTGGVCTNTVDVTFPTTAADEMWGPLGYWVVTTELVDGDIVFWSNFEQGITVEYASALVIPAGTLSIGVVVPEDMF